MPDGRTFLGSAPVEQVMRVEVVRARVRGRGRGRGRGRVGVRVKTRARTLARCCGWRSCLASPSGPLRASQARIRVRVRVSNPNTLAH